MIAIIGQMTIADLKNHLEKNIRHLETELSAIRTGRASVSLVQDILVDAYGTKMTLKELANLSAPEPQMIIIQPWDKSVFDSIVRAIR